MKVRTYRTYPWDRWINRKRLKKIVRGVDYDVRDHIMAQNIRNYAYRNELAATVLVRDGFIKFRVYKEG